MSDTPSLADHRCPSRRRRLLRRRHRGAVPRRPGHVVKMVSLTNGDAGHHSTPGPELVRRRRAGSRGRRRRHRRDLRRPRPSRRRIAADAGEPAPGHPPDPHLQARPGAHASAQRLSSRSPLHQPAGAGRRLLVTVPAVVPDTPHLMRDPVIAYLPDDFQKPYPLCPRWSSMSGQSSTRSWQCCTATRRSFTNGWRTTTVTPINYRKTNQLAGNGLASGSANGFVPVPRNIGRS